MAIFTVHLLYHLAVFIASGGAVAFAASLMYLVYFYVVTLASTAGEPEERVGHIMMNAGLFAVFALHHSVFARSGAKQLVARAVAARFERSVYVWVASALLVAVCLLWQPVAGLVYRIEGWGRGVLWMTQAAGSVMVLLAARAVNALELAGICQAAGRAPGGELKVTGPFRMIRHPIYMGWVLMVFATPTLTANRLVFAALSTIYLILAIPWEERSLVAVHGDRYRDYQRLVRWRLIPGLW